MKQIKILLFVWCIFNSNLFAQVVPEWTTSFALNYPFEINQTDMTTDKNGNVYVTGYVHDTSWNNVQIITLKYNTAGQIQWFKYIDSVFYPAKIAVDNFGNVFIAGNKSDKFITVKYNSQGLQQWIQVYATIISSTWASDITTDDSSNVYVTGIAYYNKFTTVKYSSSGVFKWAAIDGPTNGLTNSYVTLDNNRNIYILNRGFDTINNIPLCSTIKYNNAGSKKWERYYKGNFVNGGSEPIDLKYDPSGYLYVLAYTTDWNDGDYNLVKYDTLGNQIWTFSYSFTNYYDNPKSVVLDNKGNAYITGGIYPTGGTIDSVATIKVSKSGIFKWKRTYSTGYSGTDEGRSISIDSLGYLYVGAWGSDNFYRQNYITIKYDSLGNQLWLAKYKNTFSSTDILNSISLDRFGNVYLSGSTMETNSTGILTLKYSNAVAVNEINGNSELVLNVFPNPFQSSLTITSEQTLKHAVLYLYDEFGKEVLKIDNINRNDILIPRDNLADGIYFFRLLENHEVIGKGKVIAH